MKVTKRQGREPETVQAPAKRFTPPQPRPRRAKRQKSNLPIIIGLVLALVFVSAVVFIFVSNGKNSTPTKPVPTEKVEFSSRAKNFTLNDTEGKTYRLSDFAGTPVILDFTAWWCDPCKAQAPAIKKLYEEFKDRVQFFAITHMTDSDTIQQIIDFKNEEGIQWPMLVDKSSETMVSYNVTGIPKIVLLNKNGEIYYDQSGNKYDQCYNEFKQALEEIFGN